VRAILGFFTHHWKLKLAAFALAMLLWITVTADQLAVRWLSVPVEIEMRNDQFQLVQGPIPEEIQVRISGPRREFWDLGVNRPHLRLVIDNITEGTQSFAVDPQQVQIPRRVARGLTAIDVSPARVTLTARRVATANVPVQLQVGEPLRGDYAFADTLQVEPATIRVRGPQERLANLQSVRTLPLDLSGETGAFQRTVPIDTVGLSGLDLSARHVTVSGRVEPAVQQVIVDVPVRSPAGVLVVPGAVEVHLWGAESVVRAMSATGIRVTVPPESIPADVGPGGTTAPLRVDQLPPGVRAVAEPRIVRILAAPTPPVIPDVPPMQPTLPPAPEPVAPAEPPGTGTAA
jgi:hypothetical protein